MKPRRMLPLLAASLCFLPGQVASQELRIAVAAEMTTLDPHFYPLTSNTEIHRHIFSSLVRYDNLRNIEADLATSWKQVDPFTWELKLREGVKFTNGDVFTAADVEYTFKRIPSVKGSPSNYEQYTKQIKAVTLVDPLTVRLTTTTENYPLVLNDISNVTIIPSSLGAAADTKDFNEGRAVIGTGPYKLVEWKQGDRLVLERNEGYWSTKPHWRTVTFRPLTNSAARSAAILTGTVDVINQVPSNDLARLRSSGATQILPSVGMRLIHFMIDQVSDAPKCMTDASGNPLGKNPLKDPRVRLALSKAINRDGIVDRIMEGLAEKAVQLLPATYVGKNETVVADALDVAGARKLLADAGYPNGFRMTIHGPNNRYLNDEKVVQAVAQMLTRIGIDAKVETLPPATYFGESAKRAYCYFLVGLGATDPLSFTRSLLLTPTPAKGWGPYNWGGISDVKIDSLYEQANQESDIAKRTTLLQEAESRALNELHAVTPLFYEVNVWALRKGLKFEGRFDGQTLATNVTPE